MNRLFLILTLIGLTLFTLSPVGWGDVVIFINGDTRYGDAEITDATTVQLNVKGATETYNRRLVTEIIEGIDEPAPGEVASATDGRYVHKPSGFVYDITGDIAVGKTMKTPRGKELRVDIEDKFDITAIRLLPVRYSFYNRLGSYLIGAITNNSDRTWHSVEFRVTIYDKEEKLLAAKDFYVFRLPKTANGKPGRRVFEVALPDVLYEQIDRVRIVRKF
ncbi:hypothetical protein GF373_06060 [bacterium]|nr:hypothetical protein [bacterium]